MQREGPFLEQLTRRLADTPRDFLEDPSPADPANISVVALVNDLMNAHGTRLSDAELKPFVDPGQSKKDAHRNWLTVCAVGCWLAADETLRQTGIPSKGLMKFLLETTRDLASAASAAKYLQDPDRREEFARIVLADLNMRPAGETIAQAQDRLHAISSTERTRMIKAAQAAEARARKIREELARKAAAEAADKYTRE